MHRKQGLEIAGYAAAGDAVNLRDGLASIVDAGDVDLLRPFVVAASPAVAPFHPYFCRTRCTWSAATPGHLDWIGLQ